jgi:hypothetical protein
LWILAGVSERSRLKPLVYSPCRIPQISVLLRTLIENVLSVPQIIFTPTMTCSEQVFHILNTPPRKINFPGKPILRDQVEPFSIVHWPRKLSEEMFLLKAQGEKLLEVDLVLDDIHNPAAHAQESLRIRIELKGDLDEFTQRIAKHGQVEMKQFMPQGLGNPSRPQLKSYLDVL